MDETRVRVFPHACQSPFQFFFRGGFRAGTEQAVKKILVRDGADGDFPHDHRILLVVRPHGEFPVVHPTPVSILPQFRVPESSAQQRGGVRVVKKYSRRGMRGLASRGRQIVPVHPLHGLGISGPVGHRLKVLIHPAAVPEHLRRQFPSPQLQLCSRRSERPNARRGVVRMHHPVVFRPVIRQRRKRLSCKRPRRGAVQLSAVLRILGRRTGGIHPPPARGLPLSRTFVAFQKQEARRQSVGRPGILFHLRVDVDPALRRHIPEPAGIVRVDTSHHHPGFIVHPVPQQQADAPHGRDPVAALAFLEEPQPSFPPLGSADLRPAHSHAGPHAIRRPGVVCETKIAQSHNGHALKVVPGYANPFLIVLRRDAGQGECLHGRRRLVSVPVAPAEKMPAIRPVRPFLKILDAHRNPFLDHPQVAAAQFILLRRQERRLQFRCVCHPRHCVFSHHCAEPPVRRTSVGGRHQGLLPGVCVIR